ncbi:MAG: hypothetical protein ACRD4X_02980 [Candidatus Acidiferrales bacterium]
MKRLYWAVVVILAFVATGCRKAPPKLIRPATIKDVMDSIVNPNASFVFNAVEYVDEPNGEVKNIQPNNDTFDEDAGELPNAYSEDNWQALRVHLMALMEAPNLLVMQGRKVAPEHVTSQNPNIELQPWQIQKLIDNNRPAFIRRAHRLQEAVGVALKAVDEKSVKGLFNAEGNLDNACEGCHLHYWYPNDKRAQMLYKEGIE